MRASARPCFGPAARGRLVNEDPHAAGWCCQPPAPMSACGGMSSASSEVAGACERRFQRHASVSLPFPVGLALGSSMATHRSLPQLSMTPVATAFSSGKGTDAFGCDAGVACGGGTRSTDHLVGGAVAADGQYFSAVSVGHPDYIISAARASTAMQAPTGDTVAPSGAEFPRSQAATRHLAGTWPPRGSRSASMPSTPQPRQPQWAAGWEQQASSFATPAAGTAPRAAAIPLAAQIARQLFAAESSALALAVPSALDRRVQAPPLRPPPIPPMRGPAPQSAAAAERHQEISRVPQRRSPPHLEFWQGWQPTRGRQELGPAGCPPPSASCPRPAVGSPGLAAADAAAANGASKHVGTLRRRRPGSASSPCPAQSPPSSPQDLDIPYCAPPALALRAHFIPSVAVADADAADIISISDIAHPGSGVPETDLLACPGQSSMPTAEEVTSSDRPRLEDAATSSGAAAACGSDELPAARSPSLSASPALHFPQEQEPAATSPTQVLASPSGPSNVEAPCPAAHPEGELPLASPSVCRPRCLQPPPAYGLDAASSPRSSLQHSPDSGSFALSSPFVVESPPPSLQVGAAPHATWCSADVVDATPSAPAVAVTSPVVVTGTPPSDALFPDWTASDSATGQESTCCSTVVAQGSDAQEADGPAGRGWCPWARSIVSCACAMASTLGPCQWRRLRSRKERRASGAGSSSEEHPQKADAASPGVGGATAHAFQAFAADGAAKGCDCPCPFAGSVALGAIRPPSFQAKALQAVSSGDWCKPGEESHKVYDGGMLQILQAELARQAQGLSAKGPVPSKLHAVSAGAPGAEEAPWREAQASLQDKHAAALPDEARALPAERLDASWAEEHIRAVSLQQAETSAAPLRDRQPAATMAYIDISPCTAAQQDLRCETTSAGNCLDAPYTEARDGGRNGSRCREEPPLGPPASIPCCATSVHREPSVGAEPPEKGSPRRTELVRARRTESTSQDVAPSRGRSKRIVRRGRCRLPAAPLEQRGCAVLSPTVAGQRLVVQLALCPGPSDEGTGLEHGDSQQQGPRWGSATRRPSCRKGSRGGAGRVDPAGRASRKPPRIPVPPRAAGDREWKQKRLPDAPTATMTAPQHEPLGRTACGARVG